MALRALVLFVALALLACSGESPSGVRAAAPTAHEAAPDPVPEAHAVSFTTSDGVTIAATLERAARPDAPAVILVHQLGSTRAEWAPLVARMRAAPAITTLAIDLRGHGESLHATSGALDWRTFDDAQWAATRLDVLAAVAFLAGPDSGVAPAAMAAVGSSIGCSAVIAAAADEPRLGTIVTISPGRAYHGFDAVTPAMQLGQRSIFAIASRTETDSVDTAQAFGRITNVPALIAPGDAHGVLIFGTDPTSLDAVEDFLRGHLGADRAVPRRPSASAVSPPITSPGTPAPAPH